MCNPNYLRDAIQNALSFDIPDHLIGVAIADQAKLLGQMDCESGYDSVDDWLSPESFVSFQ